MSQKHTPQSTDRPSAGRSTADQPARENHGGFSDGAAGLVPPSRLNEGDTGAASDRPDAGGQLNFDDDEIYSGRGNNARRGGTAHAEGADSAPLGPPAEILSDSNLPSDTAGRRRTRPTPD